MLFTGGYYKFDEKKKLPYKKTITKQNNKVYSKTKFTT